MNRIVINLLWDGERIMEKSLKIVLVDDNTDYLFTMETFLSRNGFEVKTSEDAEKGLELIRKESPDILLLDFPVLNFASKCGWMMN